MTILEKIKNDRSWRGAVVEYGMSPDGHDAWRLSHPSGAVAYVYKEAAQIQVRHWDAYLIAKEVLPIVRAAEIANLARGCALCQSREGLRPVPAVSSRPQRAV